VCGDDPAEKLAEASHRVTRGDGRPADALVDAQSVSLPVLIPLEVIGMLAAEIAKMIAVGAEGAAHATTYMTVTEAAEYLRWPQERIYKLTAAGAIPHLKHNGRLLFRREELDRWLDDYYQGPGRYRASDSARRDAKAA
jgi:excisionase family DNA binding protein